MGLLLEPFIYILGLLIRLYFYVVAADVILFWLIRGGIVNSGARYVPVIVQVLGQLTKPAYDKIHSYVRPFAGIDFSPFVLMLILLFAERLLLRISQLLLG